MGCQWCWSFVPESVGMREPSKLALALDNATFCTGERERTTCLRVERGRIASLDEPPRRGDRIIDLRGERVLPGLINAHDHLQLNGLPRLKYRERYANAMEWIGDIRPRLRTDARLLDYQAVPREERLLIGGIKNLLSGVTTVAHHDPLYPSLLEHDFPVRVVTRYGWSHSVEMEGGQAVLESFRRTPEHEPWVIHGAEGTDDAAADDFAKLEFMGCVASNTVLVHGVGLSSIQHERLANSGSALVWCPASNLHLLGRTVDIASLSSRLHVALGSDSRISGSRDLLAELRVAREISMLDESELEAMVTERASRMLRVSDRGSLSPGFLADILVIPLGLELSRARRGDLSMVMIGGEARYAEPRFASAFGEEGSALVRVDGHSKRLSYPLVSRLRRARLRETGLEALGAAA